MVEYKLKNGNILKDGHTMFLQDIVSDLKRKAYVEDLKSKTDSGAEVPCSDVLVAMQAEAKLFIDANVWDGEDRSGATNDRATFDPDELQELINDMLEHMSN